MNETTPWFTLAKPPIIDTASESIVIVGAGLGGCWLARTLAERKVRSIIIDSHDIASGASGNLAGVVKPYVTRQPGFIDYFYAKAFDCLLNKLYVWQLGQRCSFNTCGVLQLSDKPYPPQEAYTVLTLEQANARAGLNVSSGGIWFGNAGYLDPQALCHALLEHKLIKVLPNCKVKSVDTSEHGATIKTFNDKSINADLVVMATGSSLTEVPQLAHLPVIPARGQTSDIAYDEQTDKPHCVVSGRHYVIPLANKMIVGASFHRDDATTELREEDHVSNITGLKTLLPGVSVKSKPTTGDTGVRATTPDRLPLVGPAPDHDATASAYRELHLGRINQSYPELPTVPRLMVLGGFGSRGIVTTAYCAELLTNYLLDTETTDNTLESYASLVNPVRFQIRGLKRKR